MHKTGIIQGARRPIKGGNLIMKKKLVAAAMAAVMAVSLTACGGSQPAETTAAATEAATEAASEEATEAASEEEKAEETEAAAAEFTTITPGKLMVGTSPDFAPYEFYHIGEDGTPQLAGFDVALAQRIADDLGLELQMVPMDFDGILMELQNGNIDLGISGFSPSPERAEVFDFSDLYYTGGQSFCIRQADKEKYTKFEDFKDLYHMRWDEENSFRDLKYPLCLKAFHSKKYEYIVQEIWARAILHNFSTEIITNVEIEQRDTKHEYQANFAEAFKICRDFLRIHDGVTEMEVEDLIAQNIEPIRPGRSFARRHRFKLPISFCYRN